MRILLINPPWYSLFGQRHVGFHIGLGYLAAAAGNEGHDVSILDPDAVGEGVLRSNCDTASRHRAYMARLEDISDEIWVLIRKQIEEIRPQVVGITAMTVMLRSALNVVEITKQVVPEAKVLVGGIHPTLCPEDFSVHPAVDCVVRGEGEGSFLRMLRTIENEEELPSVYPSKDSEIDLLTDLDAVPSPDRHAIIGVDNLPPLAFGHIIGGRGCPFNCCFCASPRLWGHRVRFRSVDSIICEIESVHDDFGTRYFYFEDDSFTVKPKMIADLCSEMRKAKLGVTWGCETRVDLIDDEMLAMMKASGCRFISLGAESGSDRSLEKIGKKLSTDMVRKGVLLARKNKLDSNVFFMIGFPWEEESDILQTIDFFKELNPTFGVLSIATPYPGTELFDMCMEEGLIDDKPDWSSFYHQSPHCFFNTRIAPDRATELVGHAQQIFDSHNCRSKRKQMLNPAYVIERIIQNRYYTPGRLLALARSVVRR